VNFKLLLRYFRPKKVAIAKFQRTAKENHKRTAKTTKEQKKTTKEQKKTTKNHKRTAKVNSKRKPRDYLRNFN